MAASPPTGHNADAPSEVRSRWNDRYRKRVLAPGEVDAAPPAIERLISAVGEHGENQAGDGANAGRYKGHGQPADRLAIDLAGGDGSAALWLAKRGFTPVLVEVSDVAIGLATERARNEGLELHAMQLDLEAATVMSVLHNVMGSLAGGNDPAMDQDSTIAEPVVALVSCFHYLNRGLLSSVAAGLPPGALFMASIATVLNLERHERPSARFLLESGELRDLVVGTGSSSFNADLSIVHDFEGWNSAGTHEAEIVVRRPYNPGVETQVIEPEGR